MEIDLMRAYAQTYYRVEGFLQPIRIGISSKEANELCISLGLISWAFITAWNPLSVSLSVEENKVRNEMLFTDLKSYTCIRGSGQDPEGLWPAEESFLVLGISKEDACSLARKYGQIAIVTGRVHDKAELVVTLHFIGNNQLLTNAKTAFLCSRKVPASAVLKCYDWAIEQREKGNCVISGFHSQLEQDVLHYLLKGQQPIIVVLARGLKENIDPLFAKPLTEGRLLIISPFGKETKRVSIKTASIRNRLMLDLADNVAIGYCQSGGNLDSLLQTCIITKQEIL